MSSPDVACPDCNGTDVVLIGQLPDRRQFAGKFLDQPMAGGNLLRCLNCSLKFRSPVYSPDFYENLYNNKMTSNWQETSRRDWDRIVDFIHRHVRPGANILDFGCNNGGLLARLDQSYRKHGIEMNSMAATIAAHKSNVVVWPSAQHMPPELRFDVIILADVVEHVVKPRQLIENLSELLAKDGVLIITTGDASNQLWERFGANWWYCVFPEHIAFISRAWLNYLARLTHLRILECDNFKYCNPPFWRKILDIFLMNFYGIAPKIYMRVGYIIEEILDRDGDISIRGVGLSADHLFIVLTNENVET